MAPRPFPTVRNTLFQAIKYIKWLSLDVSFGAIALLFFLSKTFEVKAPIACYTGLFSGIWVIYLVDHYLDARSPIVHSDRRVFHLSNSSLIRMLIGFNLTVGAISAFFLPPRLILFGLILSIVGLVYHIFSQQLSALKLKELAISIVYSLGVYLSVISMDFRLEMILGLFGLSLLAFFNLMLVSVKEYESDQIEGFKSIATEFSNDQIAITKKVILGLGIVVSILGYGFWDNESLWMYMFCAFVFLSMLDQFSKRLNSDFFRVLVDAVFPLSLLFLI